MTKTRKGQRKNQWGQVYFPPGMALNSQPVSHNNSDNHHVNNHGNNHVNGNSNTHPGARRWCGKHMVPSVYAQDMDHSARNMNRGSPPFTFPGYPGGAAQGHMGHGVNGYGQNYPMAQNQPMGFPQAQPFNEFPEVPAGGFGGPIHLKGANDMPLPIFPREQNLQHRLFLEQFRYPGHQAQYEPPHYDPAYDEGVKTMEKLEGMTITEGMKVSEGPFIVDSQRRSRLRAEAPEFVPAYQAFEEDESPEPNDSGSTNSWSLVSGYH